MRRIFFLSRWAMLAAALVPIFACLLSSQFALARKRGHAEDTIALSVSPVGGGTVSGAGTFPADRQHSVTATANSGYSFVNWTQNGGMVSTSASFTFTLDGDVSLVANFAQMDSITVSASPSGGAA
jgi:Divergent InlB B-repeat domain